MDLHTLLHTLATLIGAALGSFAGNRALAIKVDKHETVLADHGEKIGRLDVRVTVLETK